MMRREFSVHKGGVTGGDFLGREKELELLMQAANEEYPKHLAIYGMPHVGKSSLLSEWMQIIRGGENRIGDNRRVVLLDQTIVNDNENGDYGCGYLYRSLLQKLLRQLKEEFIDQAEMIEELRNSTKANASKEERLKTFRRVLCFLSGLKIRTILVLDEFERAGQCWPESDYIAFMKLLMDDALNLFCVVASRAHISYVVSEYTQKIIPFTPFLLQAFSEQDMNCYAKKLETLSAKRIQFNKNTIAELIYFCGKNPYLLSIMASYWMKAPERTPAMHYHENEEAFRQHYADVTRFMLYEEKRQMKSFSHVVKCYMGTSEDYRDIIGRYIELGYIELTWKGAKYKYEDERFIYQREKNKDERVIRQKEKNRKNDEYYYYTVCPAFLNYLYVNHMNEVVDLRDLLTGLTHSIRDITKYELQKIYGSSWNEELLLRLTASDKSKQVYAVRYSGNGITTWKTKFEDNLTQNERRQVSVYDQERINITNTSLQFAVKAMKGYNDVMPVLDAINIEDNGKIMLKYKEKFERYFEMAGGMNDEIAFMDKLTQIKDARNPISHFSRYGLENSKKEICAQLCRELIESIHSRWSM